MAKSTGLLRIVAGVGAAAAAVVLSRKESRDKLKEQYNKYKEDPEGYKENAKGLANQIGSKANETIQEVRNNPQEYANRLKNDPKSFIEQEKSKFTDLNSNPNKTDDLEEGKFDDEGGTTVNNNLRVVSEEDLKNNKNALED
ncbi:YtxH domain-containing protein, partial [Staphylococcus devriesei]